ncbi:MAG: hypothetical protein EP297_04230 [Gammaproteobacteria bacterium]|nr:MAG: hypothetical protein EP297_04230 [Gammaproteobacteria bacterium]
MNELTEQSSSKVSTPFTIGGREIKKRNRNLLWGLMFSVLLVLVVSTANYRDPQTYNNALLWSVLGFLVLANLMNYVRHLRYLRLIRKHRLEVDGNKVTFYTGEQTSELDTSNIAIMHLYRNKKGLQHIQLRLKNDRGIRLEGYDRLEEMAQLITAQLQPNQVVDKKIGLI